MSKSLDEIESDKRLAHDSLINKDARFNVNEEKKKNITFSFILFQTRSIKTDTFNNYYETRKKAIASNNYLMETLRNLSEKTLNDLETDKGLKDRFHYHPIDKIEQIEKIEKIQIEEYGVNEHLVEQREKSYYQFEFGPNGYRLIMSKLGSIFIPLFVDNNHLIYDKVSRDVSAKMKYKIPFSGCRDYLKNCDENDDFEFCKALIEDFRHGTIKTKEDFFEQWQAAYGS